MIHERHNDIAVEQQSLALAGVGHVAQLVGGNVQLLGQNLPVSACLVHHQDKVRILKNVLNFPRREQILDVLRNTCRDSTPLAKAFPDLHAVGCRLLFPQQKVEFINVDSREPLI